MKTEGRPDLVILLASLLLLAFGLTMVQCASAALVSLREHAPYFERQVVRSGIGLIALVVAYVVRPEHYHRIALVVLSLAVGAVLLTFTKHGLGPAGQISDRWLGAFGVVFQPSEVLKLALVVHLAHLLAKKDAAIATFRGLLAPTLVVLGLAGMIALQPNMGTAVILALIGFGMIFVAGARLWHLLLVMAPIVAAGVVRVLTVPYERERLMSWLEGGERYQVDQSLTALGSGGWLGVGFGESVQKFLYLPAPHTDFIFAIIGEEGGFIVALSVLVIYGLIVARALRVSLSASSSFRALAACGVGLMIGVQVVLNIAVVTGLIPTTGLPLPLLSYGGSSLIVHLAAIGVLLRLSREATETEDDGSEASWGTGRMLRCS